MQISAEKFLILEEELKTYRTALSKAIDIILEKGVTEHPIFIAHQDTFQAGIPIIKRHEVKGNWNINVSSLEEFIQKRIIVKSKIASFKKTYKSPDHFICFFVLSELGAQFVFVPR